jgi:hypothetical protein
MVNNGGSIAFDYSIDTNFVVLPTDVAALNIEEITYHESVT